MSGLSAFSCTACTIASGVSTSIGNSTLGWLTWNFSIAFEIGRNRPCGTAR